VHNRNYLINAENEAIGNTHLGEPSSCEGALLLWTTRLSQKQSPNLVQPIGKPVEGFPYPAETESSVTACA